jgi:hypothetical protein
MTAGRGKKCTYLSHASLSLSHRRPTTAPRRAKGTDGKRRAAKKRPVQSARYCKGRRPSPLHHSLSLSLSLTLTLTLSIPDWSPQHLFHPHGTAGDERGLAPRPNRNPASMAASAHPTLCMYVYIYIYIYIHCHNDRDNNNTDDNDNNNQRPARIESQGTSSTPSASSVLEAATIVTHATRPIVSISEIKQNT